MRDVTLCFLVRGNPPDEILLGFKKVGFGVRKYNGFGGKVELDETIKGAAIREVEEEVGIKIIEKDLDLVGRLKFLFPANPAWDRVAHVFLVTRWDGDPVESVEMRPAWFKVDNIPFEQMWQGDIHWLPCILAGERILGCLVFGEDNETVIRYGFEELESPGAVSLGT